MVAFIKKSNCKICNIKGKNIFKKNYSDNDIIFFFEKNYGQHQSNILKKKLANNYFILLKCEKCKFIWQENSPDKNFSEEIYDKIINKQSSYNKSKLKFINNKLKNKKEIYLISKYFKNIKKINILDFGAGWGHWLNSGDKSIFNSYAFEYSAERKKYLMNLGIKVINNYSLPLYKNFFHYIRLDQVLEHVENPIETLKLLKNLARKDCLFYLSVPDGSKFFKKGFIIKIEKGPTQPLEHLNCFSRFSLIQLLTDQGFKKISLFEIILIHSKSFFKSKINFFLFLSDIKDYFTSTSIKFKIK